MKQTSKILVTGSRGLIGSELVSILQKQKFLNLLTPTHKDLDLEKQDLVNEYFKKHKPEYVFHLAAKVGGIYANMHFPADFIYINTVMHSNIFYASKEHSVKKVLFPGSACAYPKFAPQPMKESDFLNGPVEPTNLAYATSKINGIIMAQSFARQHNLQISIPILTNAYGPNDSLDEKNSHVIPALLHKFHKAKVECKDSVTLWGSGKPIREFMHSRDAASALLFLMERNDSEEIINVGTTQELSISELATLISKITGFTGTISFDNTKPDGAPRKCLDSTKIKNLGWKHSISIEDGIKEVYSKLGSLIKV